MRQQPKLGLPEREKRKRTFPRKALTCSLDCSQNKELSEYQRRASWLHVGPSPPHLQRQRGRRVTARARRQGAAALSAPESGIFHQTASRLPVANHVFLGSWMVDICQECHSLRSAPQRRYMVCLELCFHSTPGKLGWDRAGE